MIRTQSRRKFPESGIQVRMGQIKTWVGFYILCCCFMVVLFNSPASCDSLRRMGPLKNGFQTINVIRGYEDVGTEKLLKAAESSLRVGKGIGSNNRLAIQSVMPTELDDREVGIVQRRLLGENATGIERRGGAVNVARKGKRVGIDRKVRTYPKQSFQKGLKGKGAQNYNTPKEKQGRRSNGDQDLFKSHEEQSEFSQAKSGSNKGKLEDPRSGMTENIMSPSKIKGESEGNELRNGVEGKRPIAKSIHKNENKEEEDNPKSATAENEEENNGHSDEEYKIKGLQNGIKGKRPVSKSIRKVEKEEEEENPNTAIQENQEENNGGDGEEEYNSKGLQNGIKVKKRVSKSYRKARKEEEEEDQNAAVQKIKEKNRGEDSEKEDKRTGVQNEVKDKRAVPKSIRKDETEEEEEDINAAIQETKEKYSGGDGEEEYKIKRSQNNIKGKRPVSKSIPKDETEEEEEDTNAAIQENKGKYSDGDSKEEYKRKGSQNNIKGKRPVAKSIHKDEKEEEEYPNDGIQENKEKNSAGDSEEEYKMVELQNEIKGKKRVSKSTRKEEKGGANPIALMPNNKDKEGTLDSEEESNRNESQAEVKEEKSVLQFVGKYDKYVNDDGLELAEEILSPEDQSFPENLVTIKNVEESREEKSQDSQELKVNEVEWDQAVSDKQTKRRRGIGKGTATQIPQETSADGSTERKFKDDDIESSTNTKLPQSQEDNADEFVNFGAKERDESKTDPTDKQSKSNNRTPEEENTNESADNDMEEESESETVPTNKQSKFSSINQEEENADESQDNGVKENIESIRIPTKKRSKSKFRNPEEENADESADNEVEVDTESETVPTSKQLNPNFSNLEEDNADEVAFNDVEEDNESRTVPTNKKSKSNFSNLKQENADESADNDLKEDVESQTVPKHTKSKFSMQEEDNADESANDDTKKDAESEIPGDKQSISTDIEESSSNSTDPVEGGDEEYSDFIQEMSDLPSKFQHTAGKVADKLIPEIQKFSNKSKLYFNRANEEITEGFRPLIGNTYAPFLASVISYIFVLLPLIVVIVLFDQIRTHFPLQKAILYANIYLAAYFATLIVASFLLGMEPMGFFFRNSLSGYIYLQLLEALGYILYLFLQSLNLIISFSKGPISAKLAAFLQCGVSIFIGLHYYITVFHRAMAQKAPHTSWKIYGAYTIVFFVLCLFSKVKYGKKEYILEQDGSNAGKKN